MKQYEIALILTEELGSKEAEFKKLLTEILSKVNGKLTKIELSSKKELAYKIKKQKRGYLVVLTAELAGDLVKELERLLKLETKILRYLIIKKE